jgi:hypothetical protein
MRLRERLTLIVGVLMITGCSTSGKISGVPSAGQKSIYKDGRQTLVSVKRNTVVIAPSSGTVTSGKRGNFVIGVKNGTSRDVLFSAQNVTATSTDIKTGKTASLKVYNYDTLVKEEKTRQAWSAVASAMQGAADSMNAANAGYSNSYGSYSGSAYNNYGASAYGSGSYSSTTYNSAAAYAARSDAESKSNARMRNLQQEGRANLNHLASTILKKQTISPNRWHGGTVKMDLPEITDTDQRVVVVVNMGGEAHRFQFSQKKSAN